MIAEISAIVAGVNMATSAIKQAAGTANDLSTIGTFLSKLGGAEVELAKAQNAGGLNEGDAVKAALARKQIAETMQEVKDLFVMSGNGHLYQECMQEMANARKAKQEELARLALLRKKRNKELRQLGMIVLLCLALVPTVVGGIIYMLMNR
jgi:thioredoxin-like negative regulator of GroEL|tara:strand:- start:249 stop:701 length:453 start_codon:yes stop_codon:yes gene_type:complete